MKSDEGFPLSGRRAVAATISVLMLLLAVPAIAQAATPGELDPSFGTGGNVIGSTGGTDTEGHGTDTAIQSDGKILVVNSFARNSDSVKEFLLERYRKDGTLDSTFGNGGIVKASFGGTEAIASSVAVLSGGKILVGGAADGKPALARFEENGALDQSFGTDGLAAATINAPEASGFWSATGSMAVLPSGKIVLGGSTSVREVGPFGPLNTTHMLVARFEEDGSLDTSFGTAGMTLGPAGAIYGLTADSSQRILAAGWSNYEFAVARFTSSGKLDTGFGSAGLFKANLDPTGSKASGLVVLPEGKILVSGYGITMTIYRLTESGVPDTTFGGGDGVVTPTFSYPCCVSSSAVAMAIDDFGEIVLVGDHNVQDEDNPFLDEWAIARLWSDGVPDPTFGGDGLTLDAFGGSAYSEYASSLALQSDGDIVAAGSLGYPHGELGIARIFGGGHVPQPSPDRLTITESGTGEGRVRGNNLACGYDCAVEYNPGETVELIAEGAYIDEGTTYRQEPFLGWKTIGGDPGTCTGTTSPCQVTMKAATELQASFGEAVAGGGAPGSGENRWRVSRSAPADSPSATPRRLRQAPTPVAAKARIHPRPLRSPRRKEEKARRPDRSRPA